MASTIRPSLPATARQRPQLLPLHPHHNATTTTAPPTAAITTTTTTTITKLSIATSNHASAAPPPPQPTLALRPFLQRVCTTNRRPFVVHDHCPSSEAPPARQLRMGSPGFSNAGTAPQPGTILHPYNHHHSATARTGLGANCLSTEEPADGGPRLLHRVKHDRSILSLAVSDNYVYAGSQSGDILVLPFPPGAG